MILAPLRRLNAPPVFESEELTQRARMVHIVAVSTMSIVSVLAIALIIAQPSQLRRMVFALVFVQALGFSLLEINRRGRVAAAAGILVSGFVALVSILALQAGGMLSPGVASFGVFVLMAGILLGERQGLITAIACAAIGLTFVLLDAFGALPLQTVHYRPLARWIVGCVYMTVVLVLLRLANNAINAAMRRVEAELAERRAAQDDLAKSLVETDKRVGELRLLHDAAKLLRERTLEPAVFHELVQLIPSAWYHPEYCEARIAYGDIDARTPGYTDSRWRQSVSFSTGEGDGVIEVVYLEERPGAHASRVLDNERQVLLSLRDTLVAWLERELAERRRRAVEAQLRQSQKMEALGTLAGGIAHDFNNIIAGIEGNATMGRADVGPAHPAKQSFDAILQATRRAADIVNRILLFSRRQDSAAERKPIAIQPVVEEAIKLLRASITRNVTVETRFADDIPNIVGDASQLFQVMVNLGTNALHAMSERGGILRIAIDVVQLDDTASALSVDLDPGQHVRVTVSDSGVGMSRETLDRLYEPFFTTKGLAGTGLGLSVVHGIVRDHGGALTVESVPGSGTIVSVYFRAVATAVAKTPVSVEAVGSTVARGSGQHVMYVDDDEVLVTMMSRLLKRHGYRCTAYSNPEKALEAFRVHPHSIDAVITDFAMPQMTGIALAERLREIRPEIPIALLSGYGIDVEAATRAGIELRMAKPVSIEALTGALRTMMPMSVAS